MSNIYLSKPWQKGQRIAGPLLTGFVIGLLPAQPQLSIQILKKKPQDSRHFAPWKLRFNNAGTRPAFPCSRPCQGLPRLHVRTPMSTEACARSGITIVI